MSAEGQRGAGPGVGALYLHVPFCAQKCAYCDFASWATSPGDPLMGSYSRALEAQLDEAAGLGLLEGCETAYVGGGTPTLLGVERLGSLVGRVVRLAAPSELTCEANPDSLTDAVLGAVRAAGATRLSVGVQSLDDGELVELGRLHDATCARERVRAAVESGLDVSVDLMCATPGQTDASWASTLAGALALGVGHVSVYPLQIEEGTALGERWHDEDPAWNDGDVQASRMEQAQAVLESSRLVRYEVASYAATGKQCRHNIAYWTGVTYLGLGTGASSMLNLKQYLRLSQLCPSLPEPPAHAARVRLAVETARAGIAADPRLSSLTFSTEFLSRREAAAEDLMLAMRMTRGAGPDLLARAREEVGAGRLDAAVGEAVATGLATWSGERLVPTARGWLLGNELYGLMWDLAGDGS